MGSNDSICSQRTAKHPYSLSPPPLAAAATPLRSYPLRSPLLLGPGQLPPCLGRTTGRSRSSPQTATSSKSSMPWRRCGRGRRRYVGGCSLVVRGDPPWRGPVGMPATVCGRRPASASRDRGRRRAAAGLSPCQCVVPMRVFCVLDSRAEHPAVELSWCCSMCFCVLDAVRPHLPCPPVLPVATVWRVTFLVGQYPPPAGGRPRQECDRLGC